jgi:CheY-like chemotaxis protein
MEAIIIQPVELVLIVLATLLAGALLGFYARGWSDRRQSARAREARESLLARRAARPARDAYSVPRFAPAVPAPEPEGVRVPLAGSPSAGSGPTILIVDDRYELRAVNAAYLARHGYRIMEAGDGDAALEAVRRVRPDAILLDHSMPNRTGLEVVRELKSDPVTAGIPIVFMTAHSYGAVGRSAMAAGCASFLPKPCDPSRILREIARHAPAH